MAFGRQSQPPACASKVSSLVVALRYLRSMKTIPCCDPRKRWDAQLCLAIVFFGGEQLMAERRTRVSRLKRQTLPPQFAFASSAAAALAGATASASGSAFFAPPPVNRSITERTASRVLRSFTTSSKGAEADERRIRFSGSGRLGNRPRGPTL